MTTPKPMVDRFWAKVQKTDTCWLWTGALDYGGYGILWQGQGRSVRAHRYSYELLVGPIPVGLTIDHICAVRNCVNPVHLDPCTAAENVRRSPNTPYRIKARQTHCLRGHEFDQKNTAIHNGRRECRRCASLRESARVRRIRGEALARGETTMKLSNKDFSLLSALPPSGEGRFFIEKKNEARVADLARRGLLDVKIDAGLSYARRTPAGDGAVKEQRAEDGR